MSAIPTQPVAKHPPKSPTAVVAEAEAQWLFTEEELRKTPSVLDGMSHEDERELRTKGINFILQVGMMLKLPQLTLSTAAVFFHRFLMRHSLVNKPDQPKPLHHYQVAATALFLASKTEENLRHMKYLIVSCCRVAQKNPTLIVDEQSKDYWRWRDTILYNEDVLLEALCFDLTTDSPHRILFDLLKYLALETNKKLRNAAWAFVNDSSLTMLCLLFPARVIAAAAVYCAARHCELDPHFPEVDDAHNRTWWEVHDLDWEDIKRAVNYMAELYDNNASRQSGEQSIYVRTLHGLLLRTPCSTQKDAKTAQKDRSSFGSTSTVASSSELSVTSSQQMPASPGDWPALNNDATSQTGSERGVERGVKRERSGEPRGPSAEREEPVGAKRVGSEPLQQEDEPDGGRGQKKQRTRANGVVEEEGSEEGEVEE